MIFQRVQHSCSIISKILHFQIIVFGLLCILRCIDFVIVSQSILPPLQAALYQGIGLYYDLVLIAALSGIYFVLYSVLQFISKKLAIGFIHMCNGLILLAHIALLAFFHERSAPLDHELLTTSRAEIMLTVSSVVSANLYYMFFLLLPLVLYYIAIRYIPRFSSVPNIICVAYVCFSLVCMFGHRYVVPSKTSFSNTKGYYVASSKVLYLKNHIVDYISFQKNAIVVTNYRQILEEIDFFQNLHGYTYVSKEYPLLRVHEPQNVLGDFFDLQDTPPNIVILILESLATDFLEGQRFGGFLPYIDALSQKSLYWENCLSSSRISFGAIPSLLGSLPYGKRGFSLIADIPHHTSLFSILQQNNWDSYLFTGFPTFFDNTSSFMRYQNTRFILEKFYPKYPRMGQTETRSGYGYDDKVLFRQSFEILDSLQKEPYSVLYFTYTSHPPYNFNEKQAYAETFLSQLQASSLLQEDKKILENYADLMASFLFMNAALEEFFETYSQRPEYENTIFIITGDHYPYKIDFTHSLSLFRVPLIIYSPLITKSQKFSSVNNHSNLAPTLLALLSQKYSLSIPEHVHWFLNELDTAQAFRNIHSTPFMSYNRDVRRYMHHDIFYDNGRIFTLKPGLELEEIQNDSIRSFMQTVLHNYDVINRYVCYQDKIFPNYTSDDTLLTTVLEYTQRKKQDIGSTLFYDFIAQRVSDTITEIVVDFSCFIDLKGIEETFYPDLVFSIESITQKQALLYDSKPVFILDKDDCSIPQYMRLVSRERVDVSAINDGSLYVKLHFFNRHEIPFSIKHVSVSLQVR